MARSDKITVRLDDDQRRTLNHLIRTGTHSSATLRRAQILLKTDADGPDGWDDAQISQTLCCSYMTVRRVRQQFVAQGLEATLQRQPPTGRQYRKLDGEQEAHLVRVACSAAPEGQARWTMSLLARRLVELSVVNSIHPATVWRTLKKTRSNRGSSSNGLFHPRRMLRL
jgi:transposase